MSDSELKTFFRIFEEFSRHIEKFPSSLFARVYGIFTVKMEDIVPVNLILLNNTIQGKPELCFDLKGSYINREVKKGESSVLKDVNLLTLCKKEIFLRFSREDSIILNHQISMDTKLMASLGIMDYSLLLAIEFNPSYHKYKKQEILSEYDKTSDGRLSKYSSDDKLSKRRRTTA